jgi:hypothetical protein
MSYLMFDEGTEIFTKSATNCATVFFLKRDTFSDIGNRSTETDKKRHLLLNQRFAELLRG